MSDALKIPIAVLDRITAETGIECRILSEKTEAVLSAKGIMSVLPETGNDLLTFDIGGGSTEFLLTLRGMDSSMRSASRPLGAATLTETYLRDDPPGPGAVEQAALAARNEITSAKEQLYENLNNTGTIPNPELAGTAGTVTTLAAMYMKMERYVPYRVNGLILTKDWLSHTIESLAQMHLAQRRSIAGPGTRP